MLAKTPVAGLPPPVARFGLCARLPGQPLFKVDMNCHCFDPNKEFALNPGAWADPAPGTFGTAAAYYSDYRYQRQPQENFAFGRTFRIGEKGMSFNIRAEFSNIFNRSRLPATATNPTSTNALATSLVQLVAVGSAIREALGNDALWRAAEAVAS